MRAKRKTIKNLFSSKEWISYHIKCTIYFPGANKVTYYRLHLLCSFSLATNMIEGVSVYLCRVCSIIPHHPCKIILILLKKLASTLAHAMFY